MSHISNTYNVFPHSPENGPQFLAQMRIPYLALVKRLGGEAWRLVAIILNPRVTEAGKGNLWNWIGEKGFLAAKVILAKFKHILHEERMKLQDMYLQRS
jgi:hypothetical protein